jgi:hypothetical protein
MQTSFGENDRGPIRAVVFTEAQITSLIPLYIGSKQILPKLSDFTPKAE